ncbi:MAG: Holliday junction resolvase RuvX [Ignavibacteriales bacterium]|nr:MAG: Holliday junction resolvase RuvX [Ignavibacteriales bacterium]
METRILAIDYGLKRIGLALSDPLKIFAYPFKTLNNDNKLINDLKELVDTQGITEIVVGYPLKENGEKSSSTLEVEKFVLRLKESFKIDIILRDERYTSELAKQNILQSVTKKKKRQDKGLVDRNAACIFLQEYLDEKK